MNKIPRPEHPEPQLVRKDWINLNGEWDFEIDRAKSGTDRKFHLAEHFSMRINVPFCPESVLSGIGDVDFMECVWYTRTVTLPDGWQNPGRRTLLHFGACYYEAAVWINGVLTGEHSGSSTPFAFDITDLLQAGENRITVRALNEMRQKPQPAGKQTVIQYESYKTHYTRTTGIWQTVWMENVPSAYIVSTRYTPVVPQQAVLIEAVCENAHGKTVMAQAYYHGKQVGTAQGVVSGKKALFMLQVSELHLWDVGKGELYDLVLTMEDDRVESYFGLRELSWKDGFEYINGRIVFQRLVLDQGYFPDGIWTAPSDAELQADIQRAMDMGFNGARLHQKIFEPRYLYHCDRMGYLAWGEFPSWGTNVRDISVFYYTMPEWRELVQRDYNHPSIVGWCPLNETPVDQQPGFVRELYALTHALDGTRPAIDASGYIHVVSDIPDVHDYDQDGESIRKRYAILDDPEAKLDYPAWRGGPFRPTFISEYAGTFWLPNRDQISPEEMERIRGAMFDHKCPEDPEEFLAIIRGMTTAILDNPHLFAFCFTQLTDVEQEQNGLYTYDRKPKFPPEVYRTIFGAPAAIEQQKNT